MADSDEACEKPAPPAGKPKGLSCQVCGESLTSRRVVQCIKCKTLHHLECWRFNNGCSMYACGCRSWEEAPFALPSALPESFERASGKTGAWVGAILCGVYGGIAAIATVVVAIAVSPVVALIPAACAATLLPIAVRFGLCRDRLHPDSLGRTLHRTLDLGGIRIARQDNWLPAAEVAELQLHVSQQGYRFALYALTLSGRRILLRKEVGPATAKRQEEIDQLVQRLAVFADCTVRRMEGNAPPTPEEIGEAIAQKRLPQASPAPTEAAPGTVAEGEQPRPEQRRERAR